MKTKRFLHCTGGLKKYLSRFILLGFLGCSAAVQGILFYATADPAYNTSAPTGALQGSGWQFEGQWGAFMGTAIAPHYFITAAHIGGNVGDVFQLNGSSYLTTVHYDDPQSDLRIWQISQTFPAYASLYSASDEVGKPLVVIGRGTQRGDPVFVGGLLSNQLKGWKWGASDGLQRWGENQVASIVNDPGNNSELLRATFDAGAGPDESHLSVGDSGGGVFINNGTGWKLAGVNYTVDGDFNTVPSGPGFGAALFDMGGLYEGSEGNWHQIPDLPTPQPSGFYATRISARVPWIQSILSMAVVSTAPVLQSAGSLPGTFQDDPSAQIDSTQQTVSIRITSDIQFFRLRSDTALHIKSITRQGSNLIIQY